MDRTAAIRLASEARRTPVSRHWGRPQGIVAKVTLERHGIPVPPQLALCFRKPATGTPQVRHGYDGAMPSTPAMPHLSRLQLSLRDPTTGSGYTDNGGKAKSEGFELAASVKPVRGLVFSGWLSYNDAALAEDLHPEVFMVHQVTICRWIMEAPLTTSIPKI